MYCTGGTEPFGRGSGPGVPTICFWLVFCALALIMELPGIPGILDEKSNYLEGRMLNPDEESYL